MVSFDVPKVYPFFLLCSHLSSDSRNMMKRYGLRISSYIVPLCMGIYDVFPKYSLVIMVLECEYMLPINDIASSRYSKSFIMA